MYIALSRIAAIVVLVGLSLGSFPARAASIVLTVSSKVAPGSGNQTGSLRLSQSEIFNIAKEALEAKGHRIVSSPNDATEGIEAKIDVHVVQNAQSATSTGFAVSVGMFGISNGNANAKKDIKRVAFNYSSALVSYGGAYDFAVRNTRRDVATYIRGWIADIF